MFRKLLIAAVPALGLSLLLFGAPSAQAHEPEHFGHRYHSFYPVEHCYPAPVCVPTPVYYPPAPVCVPAPVCNPVPVCVPAPVYYPRRPVSWFHVNYRHGCR